MNEKSKKFKKIFKNGGFIMIFNKNSMIAKSYVILMLAGEITIIEQVPNIGNLREVVLENLMSEQKST